MDPIEEKLYAVAGEEIAAKNVNHGLWTKAFAVAGGNETQTKVVYIEMRVKQLKEVSALHTNQQNRVFLLLKANEAMKRVRELDQMQKRLAPQLWKQKQLCFVLSLIGIVLTVGNVRAVNNWRILPLTIMGALAGYFLGHLMVSLIPNERLAILRGRHIKSERAIAVSHYNEAIGDAKKLS